MFGRNDMIKSKKTGLPLTMTNSFGMPREFIHNFSKNRLGMMNEDSLIPKKHLRKAGVCPINMFQCYRCKAKSTHDYFVLSQFVSIRCFDDKIFMPVFENKSFNISP
jgi:hypothetical protein